jgi:hypothetical protein
MTDLKKGKGDVWHGTEHEDPSGGRYNCSLSSNSALDWGARPTPRPRPLHSRGKTPGTRCAEIGSAPGPVWTGAENLVAARIRSPDRLARSESLYQLGYPSLQRGRKVVKMFCPEDGVLFTASSGTEPSRVWPVSHVSQSAVRLEVNVRVRSPSKIRRGVTAMRKCHAASVTGVPHAALSAILKKHVCVQARYTAGK